LPLECLAFLSYDSKTTLISHNSFKGATLKKLVFLFLGVGLLTLQAYAADEIFISADDAQKFLGKDNVRFVYADAEKDYDKAHIAKSVVAYAHDLNYLDEVKKCKGLPMCEPTANNFIGKQLGIDTNTEVIVYDSGIGVNATGTWFFLTLFGHTKSKIMEGGLATWQAKKFAVETGKQIKPTAKNYSGKINWDMIASKEEVERASKEPDKYLILDSRHNLDEFTGKQLLSGLSSASKEVTVARGGAIPNAVFSPWTKYAGNKNGDADKNTLKDLPDLQKQLEKLKKNGYDAAKTVITYCHIGLGRGSFQYLALKKAGHNKTKLYIGSWQEWGNDPSLPLGKSAATE
jgi:thiosulfate/3-mercaptopyruvate sulfurtransferase